MSLHKMCNVIGFSGQFVCLCEINLCCNDVAISDLVHVVEIKLHLR